MHTFLFSSSKYHCLAPLPSLCHEEKLENGEYVIINNTGVDVNGQFTAGTIIQAHCNQNFLLKGSEFLQCLPNGKFNSPVPSCTGNQNESVVSKTSAVCI
jgi:hypothetical protein